VAFTTFVLRFPTTKYFDNPEVKYFYLIISFIICISFTHYYAYQSEIDLKTAELANLKNQLNPHFLFNAINSIKAFTLSDSHLARNALIELL